MPKPSSCKGDLPIKPGMRLEYARGISCGPITVMAVAQGYAMVRYPGAMPFVMAVKDASGLKVLPKPKPLRGAR